MIGRAHGATVVGAVLCVAVGAYQAWQIPPGPERIPVAAAMLAGIGAAPLEPGSPVALLAPPASIPSQRDALLFEATWQRPDVRWAFLDRWPAATSPAALVVPAHADPPPGWREIWRSGELRVCVRSAR